MELERQENILIIGHQVGLDCVFVAGRLLMCISGFARRFSVVCESSVPGAQDDGWLMGRQICLFP